MDKQLVRRGIVLILAMACLILIQSRTPACRADDIIRIVTVSATSCSDDSARATDLFDLTKQGFWKPKTLDSGLDEGLSVQFLAPVVVDRIEVRAKLQKGIQEQQEQRSWRTSFYLDGKKNVGRKGQTSEDIEYGIWGKSTEDEIILVLAARKAFYEENEAPIIDLNARVTSVFIKNPPAGTTSIRFYARGHKGPLPVEVPGVVEGQVTATSVLPPATAYRPENLFDGRTDFAWATDGQKTAGVGESLTVSFKEPQTLNGVMLWNGYQRSETHYLANARPSRLKIAAGGGNEITLPVRDVAGCQTIRFPVVLQDIKSLRLTIDGIYPGTRYRDVVLSELRFVGADGKTLMLESPKIQMEVSNSPARELIDRCWETYMEGIGDSWEGYEEGYAYPYMRIRLRSNGSFVSYGGAFVDRVMEGNWEPTVNGIRLFGKKYCTDPRDSEYLQAVKTKTSVAIFQANVEVIDISKLSFDEARKYLKPILASRDFYKLYPKPVKESISWAIPFKRNPGSEEDEWFHITGVGEEGIMMEAYDLAVEEGAILLYSPLFTDLFLLVDNLVEMQVYPMFIGG